MIVIVGMVMAGGMAWGAPASDPGDAWLQAQPRLQSLKGKADVDRVLEELHRRYPGFRERLRAIALLRLDTPYVLGCLGEEKPPDNGPLFRIDQADCTVLVLTSTALAHAHTWDEARHLMKALNYHRVATGDPVSYANRLHFTYDRLMTCPYYRIVAPLRGEKGTDSVTLVLNRKKDGSPLLDIGWERKVTASWLPIAAITAARLDRLPSAACGVALVRKKVFDSGDLIAHEGLVLDRRWFLHADSVAKRVRRVDLQEYLRRNADWFDGAIFFEIR